MGDDMRKLIMFILMVAVTVGSFVVGQVTAVDLHQESVTFYRVQTLQAGYTAGLRDGARCMAHKNCFTISGDLSKFAQKLAQR